MGKFNIGDNVKIVYSSTINCFLIHLIDEFGVIVDYDSMDNTYLVKFETGKMFWFPESSIKQYNLIDKDKVLEILYEVKDSDTPINRGTIMDIIRRVRML